MATEFVVGDKAVYPAQGVAEVVSIDTKEIMGTKQTFYVLRVLDSDKKIMIPVEKVDNVGLRQIIHDREIDEVYDILREREGLTRREALVKAGVLRRAVSTLTPLGPAALPYDRIWLMPGQSRRGLSGKLLDVLLERGATILPTDAVHGLPRPSQLLHHSDGAAVTPLSWLQAPCDAPEFEHDAEIAMFAASSLMSELREVLRRADALVIDFFETFIDPLEAGLGVKSSHTIGRSHSAMDKKEYQQRIEAINFAMAHDDGASHRELGQADVILIGVSRSGKTPTSLYLALQFGVMAANYPLIPEDFDRGKLPEALRAERTRLFGLTIAPERLHEIRKERRPGSKYADLDNCRYEVEAAEALMRREGIRCINSTSKSIEEIATTILRELRIQRQVY